MLVGWMGFNIILIIADKQYNDNQKTVYTSS